MSRLDEALRRARDTKRLEMAPGALTRTAEVFREQFAESKAIVVADGNTHSVAGDRLGYESIVLPAEVTADWKQVEFLESELKKQDGIPVAVGSGTINDLVKLAAHRLGRPYMCVATAASMDGYTAYGASITKDGSKQTFECPAPRAVVADIDVIRAAPSPMSAAGYADLLAKISAGADWIVADALGVEPIDPHAWETVQGGLSEALADPLCVQRGDATAIEKLTEGLLMSGFAMQAMQSSRPASGAEHQFSHLWDMEHHAVAGVAPSHGFKVGVATIAVARFYEELLELPLHELDVQAACDRWPTRDAIEKSTRELFDDPNLREVATREALAKHVERDALAGQLQRLRKVWPELTARLREHLPPSADLANLLAAAGGPIEPQQIGISTNRLRLSFYKAYYIRRRFTVLDLAVRAGVLDEVLDRVFLEADE